MTDDHPTDPAPPPPAEPFNLEAALTALLARVNLIVAEQLAQHETTRRIEVTVEKLSARMTLVEHEESTNGSGYSGAGCIEQKEGHHG